MSKNYALLTDDNKAMADLFIDFLAARQKKREREILAAIKEYENGESIGPFNSVEELMEDLNA